MNQKKGINLVEFRSKKGFDSFFIRLFAFSSAVVLATVLIVLYASGASTTIGSNISTNGTLTVGGASSLTSASLSGALNASSTLQVTGTATFYSFLGIGTTSPGALFSVQGNALIGGTTTVSNLIATGTLTVNGTATSTFANGITLSSGCFRLPDGTCAGGSGGGSGTVNSGSANQIAFYDSAGTAVSGTSTITISTGSLVSISSGLVSAASSTFASTLNVTGLTNLAGFISTGSSTLAGNFQVAGVLNASSTLLVANLSTLSGGYISSASSTISNSLQVAGLLQASSSLSVGGGTALGSTLSVTGTSTLAGLSAGFGTFSSNLVTSGSLNVTGTSTLAGLSASFGTFSSNLTTSGNLSATNLATLSGGFISSASSTVAGPLQVASSLSASTTLSVGNLASFYGGLLSTASSTFSNNLLVNGPLSASSTLSVAGLSTQVGGFISSASSTISNSLQVAGLLQASSSLSVGGGTALGSTLSVTGTSTLAGLSAGFGTFSSNLVTSGSLNVTGTSTLAGLSASFGTFSSNLTTSGNLSATNLATLSGGFISSASSTISSNLLVSGVLNASSSAAITGPLALTNTSGTSTIAHGLAIETSGFVYDFATNNVGIGTASDLIINGIQAAGNGLHVSGSGVATAIIDGGTAAQLFMNDRDETLNSRLWRFIVSGTKYTINSLSDDFSTNNNGFTFTNGGNFGVGTTSPGGTLSIQRDATVPTFLLNQTSTGDLMTLQDNGLTAFIVKDGGNVGIGTTTPGALFSVHGNGLFSGNLNLASLTATGTISVIGTSGTSTIGSITIGPNGRLGFGTTTPNIANFEVATRTIAFNSGADGSLGAWATSSNIFFGRRNHTSLSANGYVYVLGGYDNASGEHSSVLYAKLNSDGSTGSWATSTNSLPATRIRHSSVAASGYMYVIGGNTTPTDTVYYAKINRDGSTGSWQTSVNALPLARRNHSSVVANGYVYTIGGYGVGGIATTSVIYAKLNSDGSTGSWASTTVLPATVTAHTSAIANGYIYVIGGEGPASATVYYSKVNSDGTLGAWATANSLPATRNAAAAVVANGYIYVLGGGSGTNSTVYYSKINNDGSLGDWVTNSNALPTPTSDHAAITVNGYIYVIGGTDKTGSVVYASTARTLISGNLDLLGLASTTLGDFGDANNGSMGSSIFAGNIFSAGQLEVTGNASIWGGLNVNGLFSLTASTSAPQNFPIFSIQNATGTTPLFSVLYGGGFITSASSTISNSLQLAGPLSASSTLTVSGLSILNTGYIAVGSSTVTSQLQVAGPIQASSTLSVANLATLAGGFISQASSTISSNLLVSGVLNASSTLTVAGNSIFYSNIGVGTTTPGSLFSVHGNGLFSGNLNLASLTATGTISVTGTSGTSTIGSITIGPNGKIGIGTTTPNIANFEVATRTIAFNSGADGSLGPWATSSNIFSPRQDHTAVTANGYVYVIGGLDPNANSMTSIQYAKLNSDGSTGSWATSTNLLPAARRFHSSAVANGYVYVIGGEGPAATVFYAKLNKNGETGAWSTNANTLPLGVSRPSSVVANGYIYAIGGATTTTSYAKLNSDGSTGSWATTTPLIVATSEHSSVTANGYVYVLELGVTTYYAKINSDGTLGNWLTATALPSSSSKSGAVVSNGYIYIVGGGVNDTQGINVFYAKINSDGSLGAWNTNSNSLLLPKRRHASVIANGYIYALGGENAVNGQRYGTVEYASTARTLISGNLDLLGLASTTLGDLGDSAFGSVGSSIFAGNIFSAGQLEVTGGTQLWGGLSVNGLFSLTASTSAPQNFPIFSIQNATGTTPLFSVLYGGGFITSASSTISNTLQVAGNIQASSSVSIGKNLSVAGTTGTSTIASGQGFAIGSTQFAVNQGSGKVGIGTNNPKSQLEVLTTLDDATVLTLSTTDDMNSPADQNKILALDFNANSGATVAGRVNTIVEGNVGGGIGMAFHTYSSGLGESLRISSTGRVGIKTTTPYSRLQVTGEGTGTGQLFALVNSASTTLMQVLDNGNVGIGTTSPGAKLSVVGNIAVTGCVKSATSTYSIGPADCADYAELYPSSESVEPGDILTLDINNPGKVKKAKAGDNILIGAVSSNPAVIIEGTALQLMTGANYMSNPDKPAVALSGRIPVKVNLEAGDIKVGDPITISLESGVGKKADQSGRIVGYALDSYSGATAENQGKVMIFVNNTYYQLPSTISESATDNLLSQVIDLVKQWLESMKVFVSDGLVKLKELVTEKITTKQLCVEDVCVDKDGLQALLQNAGINSSQSETEPVPAADATSSPEVTESDTESPVITLNGPDLIEIEKGISWIDPGATVTDNVNDNLGIYYKVDGVETANEGRDLPQIDTSEEGAHVITYTSTDQAGNIGSASREVRVIQPEPSL